MVLHSSDKFQTNPQHGWLPTLVVDPRLAVIWLTYSGSILEDLFSSILSQFKKYNPSGNLKLNNLDMFKSLKLRSFLGKILRFF